MCAETLKADKINVVNYEMIDFPGSSKQKEFQRKMTLLLQLIGHTFK